MRKVLIANRGEIAVRIARACRDAGLVAVAVYADPDRDAVHVRAADEAYALGGDTAQTSYLNIDAVLAAARAAGADAVHPGYGFLSENADFAAAVLAAGLTWIGPPPAVIRDLGDKVTARRIAVAAGAPIVPGSPGPVADPAEVVRFAEEHGLPVAIKAAHGGGGRGLKVARTLAEIPDCFASAVREAEAAFGRGECFVERYLDAPRHVETQCLADAEGTVVVVSTRDCSLQRRHQKLVEEAPAPFLSPDQRDALTTASKAILRAAGYRGAGTCEFLVGSDGTLSFLEVNTRLQVEHPVSEEVTGIDLVREQLRLAAGGLLDYPDPPSRGHSIEFRINCEDPGRGFLPMPGTITGYRTPSGPGVRVDSGVEAGSVVGANWDSLLAKLIVTGEDRTQALQRAARALDEFGIDGIATVLPLYRALVTDPAFTDAPFRVHTRWIETDFDNTLAPFDGVGVAPQDPAPRETVVLEVRGRRVEVTLPVRGRRAATRPAARVARVAATAPSGDSLTAPMAGTLVKVAAAEGDSVTSGQLIAVIEAMKMEQPVTAHKAGTVVGLITDIGRSIGTGAVLCRIQNS
ncbi:acetyl/propionyl/methylcrotonyl-CoA carboxylase subunit alpha [Nocardia sp. NPDC058379]|uniref:acetyl/propionyl/methylcrotonyl-CoA carboxylase subunit alpha n=1 Tax=unclassified Nocardia TaxID=2637762 RepID=UPI003669A44E